MSLPFYLTGGTALSRCYYHHRYSEDLDRVIWSKTICKESVADELTTIAQDILFGRRNSLYCEQ